MNSKSALRAMLYAGLASFSAGKNIYDVDEYRTPKYNPDYHNTYGSGAKTLREFHVKGQTIMAYSRKDALKRINRRKQNEKDNVLR